MVGLKIALVFIVMMADMAGGQAPVANEPIVIETQAPTEAPTQPPTQEVYIPPAKEGTIYRIHGMTPPEEWQRYLYAELEARGYAWYMPYAVCQIFQESRWNQYSTNGTDSGLCQQKEVYWQSRAAHWGVPGASIWDPYAQLRVYAGMMCQYLAISGGSVDWALSWYFWGNGEYAEYYVQNVMAHWGALEVVR